MDKLFLVVDKTVFTVQKVKILAVGNQGQHQDRKRSIIMINKTIQIKENKIYIQTYN